MDIFSDANRRNPYPMYAFMRVNSPVFHVPPPFDAWTVFDYEGVKRVLNDHEAFSSQVPAPRHWFIFYDPPKHSKLRGLISRAFTPGVIANLEPRIRALSRELLHSHLERGELDLANDYSVPLPMKVISEMIGIPTADWPRFKHWSDVILKMSYARSNAAQGTEAVANFRAVTVEMGEYLEAMIAQRQVAPTEDLLSRLVAAEVDGERLTHEEILGFFQLLLVGGQETTTNLVNNAILCLLEYPEQLARLRAAPALLPSAIEEVLRYRSPLQWMMRTPRKDIEMSGQVLPAGKLVLAMIGSANRDPEQFPDAERFDLARNPDPHLAFGHGIHACLGAALARMEARIALTDLLAWLGDFALASAEPWEPRQALHVHGPARLPLRFEARRVRSA